MTIRSGKHASVSQRKDDPRFVRPNPRRSQHFVSVLNDAITAAPIRPAAVVVTTADGYRGKKRNA